MVVFYCELLVSKKTALHDQRPKMKV